MAFQQFTNFFLEREFFGGVQLDRQQVREGLAPAGRFPSGLPRVDFLQVKICEKSKLSSLQISEPQAVVIASYSNSQTDRPFATEPSMDEQAQRRQVRQRTLEVSTRDDQASQPLSRKPSLDRRQ